MHINDRRKPNQNTENSPDMNVEIVINTKAKNAESIIIMPSKTTFLSFHL